MKTLNISAIIVLLGALTLGMSATIDEQITAIQATTTVEERVALVNEFKTTILNMSIEERSAAINQLRSTMQANPNDPLVGTGIGAQTETRLGLRQNVDVSQMQEFQNTQRAQRANQNQVGSQYMQQNLDGTTPIMTPPDGVTPNSGRGTGFMRR